MGDINGADTNGVAAKATSSLDYDIIVVGAGFSGVCQLWAGLEAGLRVKVIEAGSSVGGVWYWNRYPGARLDAEAYTYNYSWPKQVLEEWDWSEHFTAQPETEKYINFVVDKLDLRKHIQFNTRLAAAHYHDERHAWELTTDAGDKFWTRYFITCVGPLSIPTLPTIPGVESFKGKSSHTARWPKEGIDYAGKRVAVIGTGATGVQTIQEVSKTAGSLHIFQRQPNWCSPLGNSKITPDEMKELRKQYPAMFQRCKETVACFLHQPDMRSVFDVSEEEREAFFEKLYNTRGFAFWMGNFHDTLTNREANKLVSDFIARKIRSRVKDQELAEKLIPRDHGYGSRRVPLETKYFEVYNQDNVHLVDLREQPIERITEKGVKTTAQEYEFDVVIYATGFDPFSGSFDRIDIRGLNGLPLKERWANGPRTYLGLLIEGFPNMMMVAGPQTALGNIPRNIEYIVGWFMDLIKFAQDHGYTYIEPTKEATEEWSEHVAELSKVFLGRDVKSWMTGVNTNVENKKTISTPRYAGGNLGYVERVDKVAKDEYREMKLA